MEEKILELIADRKFVRLREILCEIQPADLAPLFEKMPEKDRALVFRILPKEVAAEIFVELESDMQQFLIEAFSDRELKEVMDELFMDDTVDIIEEMPATVAKRILKQTDPQTRSVINRLLAYPEDSAGSIMTTEYIDLKTDMTVNDAFEKIRRVGTDTESIYTGYVTDKGRKLLGIVTVKDLLLSGTDTPISEIMDENVIFAETLDDKEAVAGLFEKYDMLTIPVVDTEQRLVGIVTVDDAIDVLQEEASEDIEKMAAMLPSEHTYLKTGVFATFRSRMPWLLFLMISATFTGMVISAFEGRLSNFTALIAFIPMLMGTGGNSGSQSSVTVIRALSLGEIEFRDILRVLWKEIRVAFVCGFVLSIVNFVKLYLVDHLLLNNFDVDRAIPEMLTVCATLFFVVIVAKIVGSLLPILAKKIGFDPAVMASPLVTTILDAVSLIIYFNIAGVFLNF